MCARPTRPWVARPTPCRSGRETTEGCGHASCTIPQSWREARSLTLPYNGYAAVPHFAADDRAIVAVTGGRRLLRFDLSEAEPQAEVLAGDDHWLYAAEILWRDARHRRAVVAGETGEVMLLEPMAAPGRALQMLHEVSPGMCIGADIDIVGGRTLTATWDEMIYVRPISGDDGGADIRPIDGPGGIREVFFRLGSSCVVYHRFETGVFAVDAQGESCLAPGRLWHEVQPVACDPRLLLVRPTAGGVMLWDLLTRAPVATPQLPQLSFVGTARLSPQADFLMTASPRIAFLWRLRDGLPDRWTLSPGAWGPHRCGVFSQRRQAGASLQGQRRLFLEYPHLAAHLSGVLRRVSRALVRAVLL